MNHWCCVVLYVGCEFTNAARDSKATSSTKHDGC